MSHFTSSNADPQIEAWRANRHNPVVASGALWNRICSGEGKHCKQGMKDEGTPEIVEKVGSDFYVTFHGYDYVRKQAARGVARTQDFVTWSVDAGAGCPNDAIFTALDCSLWSVPWSNVSGGCIGSGEGSSLRSQRTGNVYMVIEATDVALTCNLTPGRQWWPLGLVRSTNGYLPSPQWQQMPVGSTPFVGGPEGGEPHVGCSIQYNSLHRDDSTGTTYLAFWTVAFGPAGAVTHSAWHVYELVWGTRSLPMDWPGPAQPPPQPPPPPPNCTTAATCKQSCSSGFVQCSADGWYYCCAAKTECNATHLCVGTPGLQYCACGPG